MAKVSIRQVRSLLRPVTDWFGRQVDKLVSWGRHNECTIIEDPKSLDAINDYWRMFLEDPYCFRGILSHNISRLWTGAAAIKEEDGSYARAQVLGDEESQQLQTTRWLFDERIKRGMKQIIEQICIDKHWKGNAVQEIVWIKEEHPDKGVSVVIDDIRSVDPSLFKFFDNTDTTPPMGYVGPGLYMQEPQKYGKSISWKKVDERRFLVVTNLMLHDDRNGLSSLTPLRKAQKLRAGLLVDWARGAKRAGRGIVIGKYGNRLLGNSGATDRENFLDALKKMDSDTVTMMHKDNEVEIRDVNLNNEVFRDLSEELKEEISLVLTGSPTGLKEGEFGSYSKEESTTVRTKSAQEQDDAADVSEGFTEQVIRLFCDLNWAETETYPYMQIIAPELITPTVSEHQVEQEGENPDGGGEVGETTKDEDEGETTKLSRDGITRMQGEDDDIQTEPEGQGTPKAVPNSYTKFPSSEELPDIHIELAPEATIALEAMPAKKYEDVSPAEAGRVFTIKRLSGRRNEAQILNELKQIIIVTMGKKEDIAWKIYFESAVKIFGAYNVDMTPKIRSGLIASFRQARSNAFRDAVNSLIEREKDSDDPIVAIRFVDQDDPRVTPSHHAWNDIVLAVSDPLFKTLRTPFDMLCRCYEVPVRRSELSQYPITARTLHPTILPGKTYQYYVSPQPGESR